MQYGQMFLLMQKYSTLWAFLHRKKLKNAHMTASSFVIFYTLWSNVCSYKYLLFFKILLFFVLFQLCCLTLHSIFQHRMRVLTVRERFCIVNKTPFSLEAYCVCVTLSMKKVSSLHCGCYIDRFYICEHNSNQFLLFLDLHGAEAFSLPPDFWSESWYAFCPLPDYYHSSLSNNLFPL